MNWAPLLYFKKENLKELLKIAGELSKGGKVILYENLTLHYRKRNALDLLKTPILTPLQDLVDQILRPEVFTEYKPQEILPINSEINSKNQETLHQYTALKTALSNPDLTLMQGPPGSGKTTLIIEMVQQFCRNGLRVLVVAPTHVAVDNIIERLHNKPNLGIQMVRIGRPAKIEDKLRIYTMENIKRTGKTSCKKIS